jgi:aspartate aminotransferase
MTPAYDPAIAVQRIYDNTLRPSARPGPEVISLASGDPDFETPAYIRQALFDAIESGHTHYIDQRGDPDLRAAIAAHTSKHAAAPVTDAEVVVTQGGAGAISSTIMAIVNPGDRVLIPEPTYSSYADVIRLVGAEPVFVPQTPDFHLDLDRIRAEAPTARMIIVCHPNNPTGVVYTRQELHQLAQIANEYDLYVMSDEAYESLVFDGVEFISTLEIPELRERLIYCQTFSKRFAMTGWRLGYVIAPPKLAAHIFTVHRTFNGAGNAAVQRAAFAALTISSNEPEEMRLEYQTRRELVAELLAGTPGAEFREPDGSFYYFIKVTAPDAPSDLVAAAIEHGVAIRAGAEYGPSGTGHFRITFATDRKQLSEGVRRLRRMIESWT